MIYWRWFAENLGHIEISGDIFGLHRFQKLRVPWVRPALPVWEPGKGYTVSAIVHEIHYRKTNKYLYGLHANHQGNLATRSFTDETGTVLFFQFWWFAKAWRSSCCLSSSSSLWLRLKNFVKLRVFVVAVNSFNNAFGRNEGLERWTPPWRETKFQKMLNFGETCT